jgi:hypothetical protein
VTGSAGHYEVRVACHAAAGCSGYITLVQHLSGSVSGSRTHVLGTRTRVLGAASVTLNDGATTTVRFHSHAKAPVAIAVVARSAKNARRLPARSRPRGASSGRHR